MNSLFSEEIMNEIERIKTILKSSQAVFFSWKAQEGWPVEYVSENITMFGYQANDFLSGKLAYSDIVHPDDIQRVAEEVKTYTKMQKNEFRQVYRLMDADGDSHWIDDRTVIERNAMGDPVYFIGTIIDITEQKQAEEYNSLLGNVVNESSEEVYIFERGSLKFTYLNLAALDNIGFTMDEARELTPFDIKTDLDNAIFSHELARLLDEFDPTNTITFEATMKRKDDSVYPGEVKIQTMEVDGRLQFVTVVRDITEHLELLAEKERENEFVQEVIDGVADSVMVINSDYTLKLANRAARKKLFNSKYMSSENPKCYEMLYQQDAPCHGSDRPCPLKKAIESNHQVSVMHLQEYQGKPRYVEILANPLHDVHGNVSGIVESVHDITELMLLQKKLKEEASELNFQATHDSLTGLPNRRLFLDRLELSLKRAERLSSLVATVFVDVDKFKDINDSLGHQAGDEVLKEVSQRLQKIIRSCDTVARMGGDEFTLILEALHNQTDIFPILQKLKDQFAKPILTDSGAIQITLSIGASCFPMDGTTHKELLHNADIALYDVKTTGRNDVRCFNQLSQSNDAK